MTKLSRVFQKLKKGAWPLIGCASLAWLASTLIYGFASKWGADYEAVFDVHRTQARVGKTSSRRETIGESSYRPTEQKNSQLAIAIHSGDEYLGEIAISSNNEGINAISEHAFSTWARLRELKGDGFERRKRVIVTLTASPLWAPFSHDVQIITPIGSIEPWIRGFIIDAVAASEQKLDDREIQILSGRIFREFQSELGLENTFKRLQWIQFAGGPIQFVTLVFFLTAVVMLTCGLKWRWALEVGRGLSELIPYIGFLGTLIGMGGALRILGDANLADEISKAVSLGPIGSQLSVAIETTKFALLLFLIAKCIDVGIEMRNMRACASTD